MVKKQIATGLAAIALAGAAKPATIGLTDVHFNFNGENSALSVGSDAYSGDQAYDAANLSAGSTGNYAFGGQVGLAYDPVTEEIYRFAGNVQRDDFLVDYSTDLSSGSAIAAYDDVILAAGTKDGLNTIDLTEIGGGSFDITLPYAITGMSLEDVNGSPILLYTTDADNQVHQATIDWDFNAQTASINTIQSDTLTGLSGGKFDGVDYNNGKLYVTDNAIGFGSTDYNLVPEPSSCILTLIGLAALSTRRPRFSRNLRS